jgi:hypothetical protein
VGHAAAQSGRPQGIEDRRGAIEEGLAADEEAAHEQKRLDAAAVVAVEVGQQQVIDACHGELAAGAGSVVGEHARQGGWTVDEELDAGLGLLDAEAAVVIALGKGIANA